MVGSNDRARLLASDGVVEESLLWAGAALSAQIMPSLWLKGEARYLRDYSGAALMSYINSIWCFDIVF